MKKILAVCGRRRCGKDTLAVHLQSKHDWVHMKVSHTLKTCISYLFNLTHAEIEGDLKDVILDHGPGCGTTPRRLLQWMGTDVMQHDIQRIIPSAGRTFWIDHLISDIKGVIQNDKNVVISDIRFKHELDRLREFFPNQVVCLYIERLQGLAQNNTHIDSIVDSHESESNVENLKLYTDHVIMNQGYNLYDYIQEIENVMQKLK